MADTRRLAIRKALVAALQTIPNVLPTSVYRDPVDLLALPTMSLPAFRLGNIEPMNREWQRGSAEGGRSAMSQIKDQVLMTLVCVLDAPADVDGAKDDAAETMLGAIELALTPENYTFGGLLTDLRLKQPDISSTGLESQSRIAVSQVLEVTYFRRFGDPT